MIPRGIITLVNINAAIANPIMIPLLVGTRVVDERRESAPAARA